MLNLDIWNIVFGLLDAPSALNLRHSSRFLYHTSNSISEQTWRQWICDFTPHEPPSWKDSVVRLLRPLRLANGAQMKCSQRAGPPTIREGFRKRHVYLLGHDMSHVVDYQEWTITGVATPPRAVYSSQWHSSVTEFSADFDGIVLTGDKVRWIQRDGNVDVYIPAEFQGRSQFLGKSSSPHQTFLFVHRSWEDSEEVDKQDFVSDVFYVQWGTRHLLHVSRNCVASLSGTNCLLVNGLLIWRNTSYRVEVKNMLTKEQIELPYSGAEIGYHDDRYVFFFTKNEFRVIDTLSLTIFALDNYLFDVKSGIQLLDGEFNSWLHPSVGSDIKFILKPGETVSLE